MYSTNLHPSTYVPAPNSRLSSRGPDLARAIVAACGRAVRGASGHLASEQGLTEPKTNLNPRAEPIWERVRSPPSQSPGHAPTQHPRAGATALSFSDWHTATVPDPPCRQPSLWLSCAARALASPQRPVALVPTSTVGPQKHRQTSLSQAEPRVKENAQMPLKQDLGSLRVKRSFWSL